MRLDEAIGGSPELLGEQPEEDVLHAGMLALQRREVVPVDRACLSRFERLDRGRAPRVGEEERELAEALSRPEHVHEHAVAERRQHARAEAAAHDQVQRVGRIVAMEHDLALGERAAASNLQQDADIVLGDADEQRPLHRR